MANRSRGEVTLELGGERYVLRPEFGVVAQIEDELDGPLIQVGLRLDRFEMGAKELLRTTRVVLAANGYEVTEARLAEAIAGQGVGTVMAPLLAFVASYLWGGQDEKKDGADGAETGSETAEPAEAQTETSGTKQPSTPSSSAKP